MLPPLPNGVRRHFQVSSDIMDIPTMLSVPLRNSAMPRRKARLVISTIVRHSTYLSYPAALTLDISRHRSGHYASIIYRRFQIVFPARIPLSFHGGYEAVYRSSLAFR